jgi:NitT/TauT family transport system ATP-binding protein
MSDGHALQIVNVTKRFGGAAGLLAVSCLSFDVRPGEFISLIGPSGCGKSTLFNIIGGFVKDYQGEVLLDGSAKVSRRSVGMVFQEESTFPWRTTLQNVTFPLEANGTPSKERIERARHFIRLVGLEGFENNYPAELSGGMRQRTAIARHQCLVR